MRIIKASVERIEDFQRKDMVDALKLMGFTYLEMNFYRRTELNGDLVFYAELYDDAVLITVYSNNTEIEHKQFVSPIRFIDFIESALAKYDIETARIVEPEDMEVRDNGIFVSASRIVAKSQRAFRQNRHDTSKRTKTTTKDFVSKLSRVKSSNVWSYAFQPKDDQMGDMLMQFKAKNGGPGDIYIYYNVPNKIWQRLVAASSKGHFFWEFIRNIYTYAKLTGDKKTKLANGI